MLHGDIFRLNGNSIAFFEEAFDLPRRVDLVWLLDHLISERCWLWLVVKKQQLQIHKRIFEFFEVNNDLIFTDENTAI